MQHVVEKKFIGSRAGRSGGSRFRESMDPTVGLVGGEFLLSL